MKVVDIMQRQIITVTSTTKLREVGKIIFGLQIAGVPVVKGKKLLGLITQTDILHNLYPTYQEFMEDYVHAKDFEAMEEVSEKILNLTAGEIMNKGVSTVTADTPVMRVQSLMLAKGFGRVPVVDGEGNLLGIVSQGDVFRAVVGQRLPFEAHEEFHDWLSRHFDLKTDWQKRLSKEIPDLVNLFKQEHVKKVLDFGSGTGGHTLALAAKGFSAVGIDQSALMIKVSNTKKEMVAKDVRENATFIRTVYKNLRKQLGDNFDSVIFMGNAFCHELQADNTLEEINSILNRKAVLVFQIINFEKVFTVNNRFLDFKFQESHLGSEEERAFLEFYDSEKKGLLRLNTAVFGRDATHWRFQGMHSTPIVPIDKEKITKMIKKFGFSKISFFGADAEYDTIFQKPFKRKESYWLNVIAKRG
ncbi:MAG: CBS domain-containing protein [Candidatus Taylorbacteria bacterium]|nr:CBS domain-containing protein [Candidatus Taylorbacteria bacterium]